MTPVRLKKKTLMEKKIFTILHSIFSSLEPKAQGRVPTGQGKVREICFFFKVREKSGNSVKWSGNFKIMLG